MPQLDLVGDTAHFRATAVCQSRGSILIRCCSPAPLFDIAAIITGESRKRLSFERVAVFSPKVENQASIITSGATCGNRFKVILAARARGGASSASKVERIARATVPNFLIFVMA
jgi:hypothetical protein